MSCTKMSPGPTVDIVMACVMVVDTFTVAYMHGVAVCFSKDLKWRHGGPLLSPRLLSSPPLFTDAIREPTDSKQPDPSWRARRATERQQKNCLFPCVCLLRVSLRAFLKVSPWLRSPHRSSSRPAARTRNQTQHHQVLPPSSIRLSR